MTYADEYIQLEKWRRIQLQEIQRKYPQSQGLGGKINAAEHKLMEIYLTRAKAIFVRYPNGPTEVDKKKIHKYFQKHKQILL